jgi:hypothetical protein
MPAVDSVFLAHQARALLVVHAVLGATTVGVLTHLAVFAFTARRGGDASRRALSRVGALVPLVVLPQLALGLAIYPAYKVGVRLAWLDAHAPWAAMLFELKEHAAALVLPLALAAGFLARRPAGPGPATFPLALAAAALAWGVALAGFYVTSVRGLGTW